MISDKTQTVKVEIPQQQEYSYPIIIGENILNKVGELVKNYTKGENERASLAPASQPQKLLIVTNKTVYPLYGEKVKESLLKEGFEIEFVILEDGEKHKNIHSLEAIWQKAIEFKLERKDAFIALGGGVVGDVTGFAAATYLRGIDFVQIPTTLLSQVDSSVGGKVAINNNLGKNLIGSFYQPKFVLTDISTLKTLSESELKVGLAEVLKYGMIEKSCGLSGLNSTFLEYLKQNKIIGIEGIDTRQLVKHIREKGSMKGIISTVDLNEKSLLRKVKLAGGIVGKDLVKEVTNRTIYKFKQKNGSGKNVVVMDFGVKMNILRSLYSVGLNPTIVPASTSFEKIMDLKPLGIMLSNGPGDPEAVTYAIETVKKIISSRLPVFGICLGHQILGLAMGGKTYKLKFGHHGSNQPIKNLKTGRVQIAAENHNFAVDLQTLKNAIPTHKNLNDGTLEGIGYRNLPVFSVQFHPEASPGPHDSKYLFLQFADSVENYAKKNRY